jgi:CheY-like chemotaxis protein
MNRQNREPRQTPEDPENSIKWEESHARALLSEIVLMVLFVIISYVVAASFDIYEKFHFWSRGYEAYNLDEAPVILFALALALLEKEKDIDLLFTDILMPGGMDGWELAQRARDMVPGLGVFYASANPEVALESGIKGSRAPRNVDLLRKPYGKDEIIRCVRHALEAPGERPCR